ncbi:MAG: hypothetical protein ACXWH4_11115 [Candidatus Aminicenantales bacterium]
MHRSPFSRRLALFLPALCLASAAAAATVPAIRSDKLSTPVLLDGKTDDWTAVPRVYDPKSGAEFAFQNDARNLYILVVMKKPEPVQSIEATGMIVLGRPGGKHKPAKGALFLNREISADGYIVWRESQGAVLTDADKAEIRKLPRHPISLAFAVDAKGSSYGPLRRQTDVFPPDSSTGPQEPQPAFEFRIPLASPDLVPGGIGGVPGAPIRISFEWGGTDRSNLSTEAGRESPNSRSGYVSGTGRTWGQEYLDSFDSLSRPRLGDTKKFSFAVDVTLADAK